MITRLLLGIVLFFGGAAIADTAPAPTSEPSEVPQPTLSIVDGAETTLDQFLWTARPIVVFADSPADPRFIEQLRFLSTDPDGLLLRDVVVLIDTSPKQKSALRETLRPRGFMLVLIDKDGQVKLRKPAPWTVREITRSIDKWPTRQQELREQLGKE
ncbi:DUF4174 domain-containing protein [Thalassovita sp.]|uniref:DUF4174 domain-containing protein n=1 Tax=Thalassovita sp. TaxID=1979401 RepID=UPI0029DE584B|nr:DUF4174 domain-containing protein [Thalassovita sp.]